MNNADAIEFALSKLQSIRNNIHNQPTPNHYTRERNEREVAEVTEAMRALSNLREQLT